MRPYAGPEYSRPSLYVPSTYFLSNLAMIQLVRKKVAVYPTNNAILIKFRPSSTAEIFVNKHRLSVQIGAKIGAKKRVCNLYVLTTTFQLSFHFARHRWWLGSQLLAADHRHGYIATATYIYRRSTATGSSSTYDCIQ